MIQKHEKDSTRILKIIISALLILLMSAACSCFRSPEILFPEAAALAAGCFVSGCIPWNIKHIQFTAVMTAAACAGLLLSRACFIPMYFRTVLGIIAAYTILCVTKTSLTPAVSACLLPVLTGAKSFYYIGSVFVISALCDAGSFILCKKGLCRKRPFYLHTRFHTALWLQRTVILSLFLILPVLTKNYAFIAPPLLVAFTAISDPARHERHEPFALAVLFFMTGGTGSAVHQLYLSGMLSLYAATVITVLCVFLVMHMTDRSSRRLLRVLWCLLS